MKAFISYSLNDSEKYIVTLLAMQLREQGFVAGSSYHNDYKADVEDSRWEISRSNLFIGVITSAGDSNSRVLGEWRLAAQSHVPAILLVEDAVPISAELESHPNVIRFTRLDLESAVLHVKERINNSRQVPIQSQSKVDNTAAWLLGGGAVLGLIGLLKVAGK